MSLGLLATPTVTICKVAKMVFNVAPGNFYLSQYLEYQKENGTSVTVEALASLAGGTDAAFVTTVLTNLGLADDAGAEAFLTSAVAASGRGAALEAAITALDGVAADDATYGTAKTAFDSAVVTSVTYSTNTANNSTNAATLAAAIDADTIAAAAITGQTFDLTTAAENFVGSAQNDTFNGIVTTLTAGDTLAGGEGIDTLNFTGTTNVALPAANITGIEIINVRQTTAALASTDLSLIAGETAVNLDRANQAATFTNMAEGGEYGVIGNGSVTNTGALAIGYAAAADAAVLNFSNGTKGAQAVTVTGTGLLSQTINSTGAANTTGAFAGAATVTATTVNATTDLTTGAATNLGSTLTITGAGAVDLSTNALEAGVTTINAADNSGGVTVALGSAVTQTVTGSSGADVITSGAVLTTGSVAAGDGSDTLNIGSNVAHVNTATLAAKYTGFETLRMSGTLDMALIGGIEAVETTNAATLTNMTATQAANVQIRANNADGTGDAMSFSLASSAGSSDVLTITAGRGTKTESAKDIAALTMNGFETLNINANPGPTSTAGAGGALDRTTTVASFTADKLTAINLTGTAVTLTNVATTKAVTVDGTALTGNGLAAASTAGLTVGGSAKAGSTINGSEVRDVFTIGAEGSAYNGNGGADSITTTVAILVADGVTDGTINGGDGTDTLTISDTTVALTDNHFTTVSGMEKLALASTVGDASLTTGGAFNAAFAAGATITTGVLAVTKDATINAGLANIDLTVTVDLTTAIGTAAENNVVTTGSGNDTININGDASYVGVAGATGTIVVATRAGDDKINVTTGQLLANTTNEAITITAGTGADEIVMSTTRNGAGATAKATFVIADGDSLEASRDKITGFEMGDSTNYSDILDFDTGAVGTLATSTDFGVILSHSISAGVAKFDDAASYAAELIINSSNLSDVLGYLEANANTNGVIAFEYDSNGDGANDATMVFHNDTNNSLVELVGLTGATSVATTNTTDLMIGIGA